MEVTSPVSCDILSSMSCYEINVNSTNVTVSVMKHYVLSYTVNGERFAGLSIRGFRGFQEYREYFPVNIYAL